MSNFAARLVTWHRHNGRHDLPWQNTTDAYRVWLSEIMLQQTQVATATPYYLRFLERFPTLPALAAAPTDEVMALWSGLGYYARARNLHACAQAVMRDHGGQFPHSPAALAELPGIGRSTANSIATFCFGAQAPVLDGNVKRVFCRHFGVDGFPGSALVEKQLWTLAEQHMPQRDGDIYNQALMDLGASTCARSKPRCAACPVAQSCVALASGRTAELPTAKPRKVIPQRAATLLVIFDDAGRVMLETRPPAGIWGGLQSLPELPAGGNAAAWINQRLGCVASAVLPAPTFTHVFSHFRLDITPQLCRIASTRMVADGGAQWFDATQAAAAALPAPVRRLLTEQNFLRSEA